MTQANNWLAGIDWLAGSYPSEKRREIKELVDASPWIIGEFGQPHDFSRYLYNRRVEVGESGGACMYFDVGEDRHSGRDGLVFPGQVISQFPVYALRSLCRSLDELGFRATRIDICLDDFSGELPIAKVWESCSQGELVGARKWEHSEGFCYGRLSKELLTLGSRQSPRYIRIYDKGLESDGETDSIRWELESKARAAIPVMNLLCSRTVSDDELPISLGAVVLAGIDFLSDGGGDRHLDRRDRVAWFADFMERVGRCAWHVQPKRKTTLDSRRDWTEKAAARTLAAIELGFSYGTDADAFKTWLESLMVRGRSRLKEGDTIQSLQVDW